MSGAQNGHLAKKLQELCKALTIERNLSTEIWKHFCKHYSEFSLRGDPVHWLGCALYLKCTSSCTRTPLNFTKLLRSTNMSLINFFTKTKTWADHCNLHSDSLTKFESLQRGFAVSMVTFKKFRPIFYDMFLDPNIIEASKNFKTNKRSKMHPPTTKKLFEFTWALYICVKSSFPEIKDDLVHSFHLLLAACDYVFTNAFLSGRTDIINPKFPDCASTSRLTQNCDVPCIIDILCERHNGVKIDAKQIKEYSWKRQIRTLFEKKYLKGDSELLTDVLDPVYFETNNKNIEKLYDEYIIGVGDFDERLYLANSFLSEIAGTGLQEKIDDISIQLEYRRKNISSKLSNTPLTGDKYFKESIANHFPSYSSTSSYNNIAILQVMVYNRAAEPSASLKKMINSCGEMTPSLETKVSDMAQIVLAHFTEPTDDSDQWTEDLAINRVDMSKKLYYRFLEKLLAREISKSSFNGLILLKHDVFHKTLFACAVELVNFTHNSPFIFPWILETLHISAYHFSRIIEVVVRADELLGRDMIKHLNRVEEIVLESLAWRSDSPLWKAIVDTKMPIPSCEDVCVKCIGPKQEELSDDSSKSNSPSQLSADNSDKLASHKRLLNDTPGASLADKFQSPGSPMKRPHEGNLSGGPPKKLLIMNDGIHKIKEKPKRSGPMALFFRKFYYLASVRLQDMCNQLSLNDDSLRQKIWTSFELTVINHANLMIDRHLDQILMCSIYVICKIVGPEQKFTHMMKCYRNQPQAQSKVYRNVLMGPERNLEDLMNPNNSKSFIPDIGDIIKFYNKVFVNKVEDLVRRFKNGDIDAKTLLSPIPINTSVALQSPRRLVSDNHSVYVRCLNDKTPETPNALSFHFAQSPVKNLRAINRCISLDNIRGKCFGDFVDDNPEIIKELGSIEPRQLHQKVKDMLKERMVDTTENNC